MAKSHSDDTRFADGSDAGNAALYGDDGSFDAGAVDRGNRFHVAAGVRVSSKLRAQLEFGLARGLGWRGSTNYQNAGEHQPSEARLDTMQLLLAGFHDFPGRESSPRAVACGPFWAPGRGSPTTA